MSLKELKPVIHQLYSFNGYEREAALKQLKQCFEPELFPHLLIRLSDYVLINRQLAAQHLMVWAERVEFADLCVDFFLYITAAKNRVRKVKEIDDLISSKIATNLDKIKLILKSKQGRLTRSLFYYILTEGLIHENELLTIAKNAPDQVIRSYWTNFLLKQNSDFLIFHFEETRYIDIKKIILNRLFCNNELNIDILISALISSNISLMDFAIFILKKQNFDFSSYFKKLKFSELDENKIKIHLFQMIFLNWDKQDFYLCIYKLNNKSMLLTVLIRGLKEKYISMKDFLDLVFRKDIKLQYNVLAKILRVSDKLEEMDDLYNLIYPQVDFCQRLEIYEDLSFWDKIYWLTILWKYCDLGNDENILKIKIIGILENTVYQYYSPAWEREKRERGWILFQAMRYKLNLIDFYENEYGKIKDLLLK